MDAQQPLEALHRGGWLEFFGTRQPLCPHCGTEHDVSEAGTWRLYEEGEHEMTCERCDLDFTVSTRVSYSFLTDTQESQP